MIQIIGKTGMLGMEMVKAAEEEKISVDSMYVDITSIVPEDIRSDIVINCSGVAPSHDSREKMISVNQTGPRRLALACDKAGARLVHISTDAVFNRPGPHPENHHCDPSSAYGRTKMLGEIRNSPHLTVRTSFIGYGRRGIVSQLALTNDVIPASTRFLWSGNTAAVTARAILMLAIRKEITGLIHIPGDFQTRYDLVMRLIKSFGLGEDRIHKDDTYVTDRRLVSMRWRAIGLKPIPRFEEQLEELTKDYSDFCSRSCRTESSPSTISAGSNS